MKKHFRRPVSIRTNVFLMAFSLSSLVLLFTSLVFLSVFSSIVHRTIETQAKEINKQIVLNFESYINSIIETANYLQLGIKGLDASFEIEKIDALFQMNKDIKKDMISIFLFDYDGKKIAGPTLDFVIGGSVFNKEWFQAALGTPEIYIFKTEENSSAADKRTEAVISVSKKINFLNNNKETSGVLLLEFNYDMITELSKKTNLGEFGHILILNDEEKLLYTSEKNGIPMTAQSVKYAQTLFIGSKYASILNTDMFINSNTLIQTRWLIVTVSNINSIKAATHQLTIIIAIIYLVSIVICAALAGAISARISKPVNQLKDAMQKIEQGNFSHEVTVSGQKEIVSLAHSFNTMIEKIQELMTNLVTQQREKRKLELRVLQNQINPHFLYNTLDSIVWLAENNRNKDVITTVVALAHFFRIGISKGETFISVSQEIAHITNYLTIQSIRYVNKFTYEINIDTNMLDKKIMKLMLQPIVENAIYHGIGDEDDGKIIISGHIEQGAMLFKVWNSGYGISEETIQQMYAIMRGESSKPSVGIKNVYQRLKIYYGEDANIIITSIQDESTTVAIRIPFEPKEETHENA